MTEMFLAFKEVYSHFSQNLHLRISLTPDQQGCLFRRGLVFCLAIRLNLIFLEFGGSDIWVARLLVRIGTPERGFGFPFGFPCKTPRKTDPSGKQQ